MVIGDFRLCRTNHGDQRRLADVRKSHQSDIREELELHGDLERLAREAGLCETRNLPGGGGKMLVALAAAPAVCEDMRLTVGHIRHDASGLGVADQRAARYLDDQILGVFAAAPSAFAVFSARRRVFSLVTEVSQRAEVGIRLKDDIAASAAVAAVRSSCRDVLFAVKRYRAVAAVAGFDLNVRFIDKHFITSFDT